MLVIASAACDPPLELLELLLLEDEDPLDEELEDEDELPLLEDEPPLELELVLEVPP
jgi:hypothetical protein